MNVSQGIVALVLASFLSALAIIVVHPLTVRDAAVHADAYRSVVGAAAITSTVLSRAGAPSSVSGANVSLGTLGSLRMSVTGGPATTSATLMVQGLTFNGVVGK